MSADSAVRSPLLLSSIIDESFQFSVLGMDSPLLQIYAIRGQAPENVMQVYWERLSNADGIQSAKNQLSYKSLCGFHAIDILFHLDKVGLTNVCLSKTDSYFGSPVVFNRASDL